MKKIPIKVISTQDSNILQVRFFPTDICNFACSYCFSGSGNINKFRYPKNIKTVIKNFRTLFDEYTQKLNKTKFNLIIIGGGEPTMWPHIEQFCKEIKETHNVYITVYSFILSCHHEFVDIDHYINVADLLFSKNVKVNGLMLMDAPHWDKCVSYVNRMKESKEVWFIEVKAVVDAPGHGMDVYTKDQLDYLSEGLKRMPKSEWLLKRINDLRPFESIILFEDGGAKPARPHDLIVNDWTNFKGWKCNVALETLLISYDGGITGSCQEPIFFGKKFNMFSETFSDDFVLDMDFKPIICPRNNCTCQPETHVTKSLI